MLNSQQQKAVDSRSKKIVCLAGAGSGKTFTLIERISKLVDEGVKPASILVLTFTKAAAFEMRERYCKSHSGKDMPNFRTFHSFCYSLISGDKNVREALGYASIPVIASDIDESKATAQAKLQCKIKLSEDKMNGSVPLTPKEEFQLATYRKALTRLLKSSNVITFDILCSEVCNLFIDDEECIQRYKDQYKHIMVDEFQDTDDVQFSFIESFTNSNIFVVGDVLQAIYGWRNASSDLIKHCVDSSDYETIKLYHNYRSTKCICDFANKNTHYAEPQYRIELSTEKAGGQVEFHQMPTMCEQDSYVQDVEYDFLLETLPELKGSTAILCRSNNEIKLIKSYLRSHDIEFVTGKRDETTLHIMESVRDNDYFIEWVATHLNSYKYGQYLRMLAIEEPENKVTWFYENFSSTPQIKYLLDTVIQIRRVLKGDSLPYKKCEDVFKLLGMKPKLIDTNATDIRSIVDYILDVVNQKSESDIYVGTIHSVKGLEYDNVIVLGVNDRSFPLKDEESKNLYYVAITRAKNTLHVWYCDRKSKAKNIKKVDVLPDYDIGRKHNYQGQFKFNTHSHK